MGELKVTETEYALLVATTVFFSGKPGAHSRLRVFPQAATCPEGPRPRGANRPFPPRPHRPPAAEEQAARRGAAGAAARPPLQVLQDPPPRGPPALRPPHRAPDGAAHPQPRARGGAGDVAHAGPAAARPAAPGLGAALGRPLRRARRLRALSSPALLSSLSGRWVRAVKCARPEALALTDPPSCPRPWTKKNRLSCSCRRA